MTLATKEATEIIEFPSKKTLLKVDLGCGNNKQDGYFGIDITKDGTQADKAMDLLKFPWELETESVGEFFSSHHFEHIPQNLRGKFMDEVYRCLVLGGTFRIITPYAWSRRAVQDFTHEWPPIVPESYLYFNKEWRQINGLTHWEYDLKSNFEIQSCQFVLADEWKKVPESEMLRGVNNNINVAEDMVVVLGKL